MAILAVGLLASVITLACSQVDVPITSHWSGGFQGEICIDISKELSGWKGHLTFSEDVDEIQLWDATATKVTSREYLIESKDFNADEHPGDQLCFNFQGSGSGDITPKTTFYIEGMDGMPESGSGSAGVPPPDPHTGGGTATKDYAKALGNSILFYDAQRSGKLPANNPIPWRGDSAVDDCVPGGWYDAGDHVKFGLPMASSTTLLLWSLVQFKDGYEKANQLDMMYDMIKWPLDYYLAGWDPTKQRFIAQVGDGFKDHEYWGRPEEMTMERPCQWLDSSTTGSDIAAETAASLALGAIAFKDKGDTAYSAKLLQASKELYEFAKANRGIFQGGGMFYSGARDIDELCEASMFLYRATGDDKYLAEAETYVESAWGWAVSWDDKKVVCQELLYEDTGKSDYKEALIGYFGFWLPGGQVPYTPCGLAWRDKWGANRYAGNTVLVALMAAEAGLNPEKYRAWAIEQINFMLGDNDQDGGCYSFQIGYGSKYPLQPHHRAASCPDRPAPCSHANLEIDAPSPQVLIGALVGGPDQTGAYVDRRTDYVLNEVATDYNSGFQGSLAGIVHLQNTGNFPPTNNKCPCKS